MAAEHEDSGPTDDDNETTIMNCREVESSLWRYIDRELAAREIAATSAHLRVCPGCARLYEDLSRDAALYRVAFAKTPFGDDFVDRFRVLLDRSPSERTLAAYRVPRRSVLRVLLDRAPGWIGVAAIVIVIPAIVFFALRSTQPRVRLLGEYTVLRSDVRFRVEGGQTSKTVNAGQAFPLRPGSDFEVPENGKLRIELRPEEGDPLASEIARLEIDGPARIVVPGDATLQSFRASLRQGAVSVRVAPRRPGETFALETPDAVARVIGTSFRLAIEDGGTRLTVQEGVVAFAPRSAAAAPDRSAAAVGSAIPVREGEASVAKAGVLSFEGAGFDGAGPENAGSENAGAAALAPEPSGGEAGAGAGFAPSVPSLDQPAAGTEESEPPAVDDAEAPVRVHPERATLDTPVTPASPRAEDDGVEDGAVEGGAVEGGAVEGGAVEEKD